MNNNKSPSVRNSKFLILTIEQWEKQVQTSKYLIGCSLHQVLNADKAPIADGRSPAQLAGRGNIRSCRSWWWYSFVVGRRSRGKFRAVGRCAPASPGFLFHGIRASSMWPSRYHVPQHGELLLTAARRIRPSRCPLVTFSSYLVPKR